MIKVHAYGAGVQSVYLLQRYLRGDIERPDVVMFADTQSEPESVYRVVERDRQLCAEAGVMFEVVTAGNLGTSKGIFIPAYTLNKNGHKGILMRQCTDRFKIRPMRRRLRAMGVESAEMWLGISTDEASRMKPSNVRWITNRYPLIEMNVSRSECEHWLSENKIFAAKSACVFCPYRNARSWKAILDNEHDLAKAVEYDDRLRERRKSEGTLLYVHKDRLPVRFLKGSDNPEINLFENECEGYCGL